MHQHPRLATETCGTSACARRQRENGARAWQRAAVAIALALLATTTGCTTTSAPGSPLVADQRVVVEGRVASVDMAPMAYDGNALVVVGGTAHGEVTVHLPARRNLCRAQGFDLLPDLRPGERVRVAGTASGPRAINVCLDAADLIERIK